MAGLVKAQAGSLVAVLGLAALPVREHQTQHIPTLGAVHLAANGDGLTVTATTFDGTITIEAEAKAEGEMAVPLERLAGLVRHFPATPKSPSPLTTAPQRSPAANPGSSCRCFRFPTCRSGMCSARKPAGSILMPRPHASCFRRPAFAASVEESQLYLNGVFLHNAGDFLAAVAIDGYRLCLVTTPAATTLSIDRSLIIPNPMVKTIDRLLGNASGNVTLRRSERLFSVEGDGFALVTKRIDQTFPDYEKLIQSEATNVVTPAAPGCANPSHDLRRWPTHRPRRMWSACAGTPTGCILSAADGSEDSLAADVEGEAETAVQIRYLVDLVGALRGDSIRLSAGGPGSMIYIDDPADDDFFAAQMPVRLP